MAAYDCVMVEIAGGIGTVTLNRPGKLNAFDGPMCRLESWDASPGALNLTLSPTSYRIFLGTNMTHPNLADDFGPSASVRLAGLSRVVQIVVKRIAQLEHAFGKRLQSAWILIVPELD